MPERSRIPIQAIPAQARDEFESLTKDLLERTRFTVNNLLRDADLTWDDLTRVILVGGSTRMPMIERMLRQESGSPGDGSLSPDEAVAHGAAIYAGLLTTSDESKRPKLVVRNVNSHDLGVMGIDPKTSVLSQFQQSWDVDNLFVMDAAGFTSGACQNPTLTLMALTVRSTDHLMEEMKRGDL